ncbi:MAG: hypothetical protein M3R24_29180 [Chloroflexota bacterium]|nr:hypothetical protein [Chloroflexota bacterium]
MQEPEGSVEPTFTPGDSVTVVGSEAQAAAGGERGIVVGSTGDISVPGTGKVVVALDRSPADSMGNAVIAPADLAAAVAVD